MPETSSADHSGDQNSEGDTGERSRTTGADVLQRITTEDTTTSERSSTTAAGPSNAGPSTTSDHEQYYGVEIEKPAQAAQLQRLADTNGIDTVRSWASEGIPIDAMGTPSKMAAYRQRKGTPVPWDIEQHNEQSKRRNELVQRTAQGTNAGDTRVPDSVREVISSPGQSLDPSIQRTMEDRMGENFGDVQVHTGPKAAQAADDINAKAFTVGNHVAFNRGEYDPGSPEGQHVIAHELAHVRQQTGGAVSMLPQDDLDLEIDPDPQLEREAEETAQRVMQGGDLGIQRLDGDVHVQRTLTQDEHAPTGGGRLRGGSSSAMAASSAGSPVAGRPNAPLARAAVPHPASHAPLARGSAPVGPHPASHAPLARGSAPVGPHPAESSGSSLLRGSHPARPPDIDVESGEVDPADSESWGQWLQAAKEWLGDVQYRRLLSDASSGLDFAMSVMQTINNAKGRSGVFLPSARHTSAAAIGFPAVTAIANNGANCPYCHHRNNTFLNGGAIGKFGGEIAGAATSAGTGGRVNPTYLLSNGLAYGGAYTLNLAHSWDETLPWKQQLTNFYHSECSECGRRYNMFRAAVDPWYQTRCRQEYLATKQRGGRDAANAPVNNIPEGRRRRQQTIENVFGTAGNLAVAGNTMLGVSDAVSQPLNLGSGLDSVAGPGTALGGSVTGDMLIDAITCPDCGVANRELIYDGVVGATTGAGASHAENLRIRGAPPTRLAGTIGAVGYPTLAHIVRQWRQNRSPFMCTCGNCGSNWNLAERVMSYRQRRLQGGTGTPESIVHIERDREGPGSRLAPGHGGMSHNSPRAGEILENEEGLTPEEIVALQEGSPFGSLPHAGPPR